MQNLRRVVVNMAMTPEIARVLAALVHMLRPEWTEDGTYAALGKVRHLDPFDAAMRAIRAAADPNARTPGVIPTAGPHCKEKLTSTSTDTYRPPRKDEQCPHHAGQYADSCHGCRADQLAGEARPPLPANLRRPDASNHAERVRAELASMKAGLCGHGYRGCKCRDQETEPTEPTTEGASA